MSPLLTRRDFIKVSFTAGGALLIGAYLDACAPEMISVPTITPTPTTTPTPRLVFEPNLFIRIAQDESVTLIIHRSEMGQGVRTSLAMILAEELEADWANIRVEQMDAQAQLNQITSGSGSITINYAPLREAGSMARAILINAAAQTWNVPVEECKADQGKVVHAASGKKLSYSELVGIARDLKLVTTAQLKAPKDFRLIGTSVPRIDGKDIVMGKAIYGLDVRLPGMLFATVARSLVLGGKLKDYDSTQAKSVAGARQGIPIAYHSGAVPSANRVATPR